MAALRDNRWVVLAVLFLARVAMAFQFQAVAALSPVYAAHYGASLADIGVLIGLYLAPGLVIALPGGAVARRFGDRRVIAFGMGLMVAGAAIMALVPGWGAQVVGRVLAGTGGVLLNVLMTKLVTDHFAGREIGTAMGIFVNSWPVGIAAALLVLPLVGGPDSPAAALFAVLGVTCAGAALFTLGTRPTRAGASGAPDPVPLRGRALLAITLAGAIWGMYNGALGMVFGFGPAMLVEQGMPLARASATTSVVLWLVALSVPLGGLLADRSGRRDTVLVGGLISFALLLWLAPGVASLWVFVLLGLAGGLSAGPIMSLPAAVLVPGNRALGMGVFFTLFYAGVVFAPMIAGLWSARSGTAAQAFYLGAGLLAACGAALWAFRRLQGAGAGPAR